MAKKSKPPETDPAKPIVTSKVPRDEKGRILPGYSLNPKGHPGAHHAASRVARLSNHIADRTLDGRMIADELLEIARTAPRHADRIHAYQVVLERLMGKAVDIHAFVDLTSKASERPHSELASGLLESLIRALPAPTPTDTDPQDDTVEGEIVGTHPVTDPEKPE